MIEFDGVSRWFQKGDETIEAVRGVSLTVQAKEFTAVIGPSGCGKSTLLRMVAGLMTPSAGAVYVNGQPVKGINTAVGFVTQDSNLFPWMTMVQNIEFPLRVRGHDAASRRRLREQYISMVGLEGFEKHYPFELSGGMQKRASIIRTLVYAPEIVLMDEPFGSVDAQTKMVLQSELLRLWAQHGNTIVFVTHDLVEAIALADRIVVMGRRPGHVKAVLDVTIPRPRNPFEIQTHPQFAENYARLWELFKGEVVRTGQEGS